MEVIEIKLKLPKFLRDLLGSNPSKEVRVLIAAELYREGRISLGKAARIAGMSYRDFVSELARRGVPVNYGVQEWMEDLEVIRCVLGEAKDP